MSNLLFYEETGRQRWISMLTVSTAGKEWTTMSSRLFAALCWFCLSLYLQAGLRTLIFKRGAQKMDISWFNQWAGDEAWLALARSFWKSSRWCKLSGMNGLGEGSEKLKKTEMKNYALGLRLLSLEQQKPKAGFITIFKARKADSRRQWRSCFSPPPGRMKEQNPA